MPSFLYHTVITYWLCESCDSTVLSLGMPSSLRESGHSGSEAAPGGVALARQDSRSWEGAGPGDGGPDPVRLKQAGPGESDLMSTLRKETGGRPPRLESGLALCLFCDLRLVVQSFRL